mgnify:CR=1 FL=1
MLRAPRSFQSLAACVLANCASLAPATLLPESGVYVLQSPSHAHTKVRVVRDGDVAVMVWLNDKSEGCCAPKDEPCDESKSSRHGVRGYELRRDGIYELDGGDLEVPVRLQVGYEWTLPRRPASNCDFVRRIAAVDSVGITVTTHLSCTDEAPRLIDTERWRKGRGIEETEIATGTKILMTKTQ